MITFSQVYIVNKVVFRGYKFEDTLTIKFSDATSKKVKIPESLKAMCLINSCLVCKWFAFIETSLKLIELPSVKLV